MAISTYAELQASIKSFLYDRADLESIIPTFITLGESQIRRDVRHWKMQNRAGATVDCRFLPKPDDWVETIRLTITGDGTTPVLPISLAAMSGKRAADRDTSGKPEYYAHSEDNIELWPTPDDEYTFELLYYQSIPTLSATTATNWLLSEAPDVYLYGSLIHAAPYLSEDNRLQVWSTLYAAAVQRLNDESDDAQASGTGLRLKVRGMG